MLFVCLFTEEFIHNGMKKLGTHLLPNQLTRRKLLLMGLKKEKMTLTRKWNQNNSEKNNKS
jgi:hypothetical protein